MKKIEDSLGSLEEIKNIVEKVKSKTNVINDIVFKTQLLSFNASIEAARAGQHGKGFAVVAEEVGKLAQMSGDASQEIDELLMDSNEKVSYIVEHIKNNVEAGTESRNQVIESFNILSHQFTKITQAMNKINSANDEKEKGVNEISTSMDQLSELSKNNKYESGQLEKSSHSVFETSEKLNALIHEIRLKLENEKTDNVQTEKDLNNESQAADHQNIEIFNNAEAKTEDDEDRELSEIITELKNLKDAETDKRSA